VNDRVPILIKKVGICESSNFIFYDLEVRNVGQKKIIACFVDVSWFKVLESFFEKGFGPFIFEVSLLLNEVTELN